MPVHGSKMFVNFPELTRKFSRAMRYIDNAGMKISAFAWIAEKKRLNEMIHPIEHGD